MRVLITGGAGYVGNRLAYALQKQGHTVTVYDTFRYGTSSVIYLQKEGVRLVRGDVRDHIALDPFLVDTDVVFHLASLVGFPICDKYPVEAREVILDSTVHIIGRLSEIGFGGTRAALIFASTGSIYGKIEEACVETTEPDPQSLYGKLKLSADGMVRDYGGISLRFATIFGLSSTMRYDLLPNDFCLKAVRERYIVLYRGDDRRTFLYIDDAIRAYTVSLVRYNEMQGEAYNVGDLELNITKLQLAQAIEELHSFNLITEGVGDDPDFRDYDVNYDKFTKAPRKRASSKLPS